MRSKQLSATALLFCALLLPRISEASWPQWRGPARDSSVGGADWPASLESIEAAWRVPLGKGYPGPIVSATRVFVAETREGDTEVVRALDRRTGEELWSAAGGFWEEHMNLLIGLVALASFLGVFVATIVLFALSMFDEGKTGGPTLATQPAAREPEGPPIDARYPRLPL